MIELIELIELMGCWVVIPFGLFTLGAVVIIVLGARMLRFLVERVRDWVINRGSSSKYNKLNIDDTL